MAQTNHTSSRVFEAHTLFMSSPFRWSEGRPNVEHTAQSRKTFMKEWITESTTTSITEKTKHNNHFLPCHNYRSKASSVCCLETIGRSWLLENFFSAAVIAKRQITQSIIISSPFPLIPSCLPPSSSSCAFLFIISQFTSRHVSSHECNLSISRNCFFGLGQIEKAKWTKQIMKYKELH